MTSKIIKTRGDQAEYSEITVEAGGEDFCCHICGKDKMKMIWVENSCCFNCLASIINQGRS